MRARSQIEGIALPYPKSNVDTDEIVPARFLLHDRRDGFADFLFRDLRFAADGQVRPEFPLNRAPTCEARLLIAGANFGCGSSREHAVWALLDYGIEAVIAPSFADIFRNNARQNGLLLVVLPTAVVDELLAAQTAAPHASVRIDIPAQQVITTTGRVFEFALDPRDKARLLQGHSPIGETLALAPTIDAFERAYRARFPWTIPPGAAGADALSP